MANFSFSRAPSMIVADFSETLCEITVDNIDFKITWNPVTPDSCILWLRNRFTSHCFEALGKFSRYDKRAILEFVTRYTTDQEFCEDIHRRRFARRVEHMSPAYLENMERLSLEQKTEAYRNLFNLDADIDPDELAWRRKIMAKRFHPDAGGSDRHMMVINDAYEHLLSNTE